MGIKVTDIGVKVKGIKELVLKNKVVFIILIAGIVLIAVPWGLGGEKAEISGEPAFSLAEQEKKIGEALSEIEGAGKVRILLTLRSGAEQEIAWDEDISYKTQGDGSYDMSGKNSVVKIQTGSGYQSPVTLKYIYPRYEGALVICQSSSAAVRLQLTEAVASLTGLTTDKITVVKGK